MLLGIVAIAIAMVTLWLGGELVFRMGVGIDDGANVDAPSSLSSSSTKPIERRRDTSRPARIT